MLFKTIIQGRLEFGNKKSYDKVLKMYLYREENYHKSDVIFKESEAIFNGETFSLVIPRYVGKVMEKTWRNTVSLIDYCSQFAVAGSVRAWLIDEGKILHYELMEPLSEKAAVQQYLKGRSLVKKSGKESEAIEALNKAIDKYNMHAQAYERRGKVNFILKNYHDAMRDYNKCIAIDDSIPNAYYGRAKVNIFNKKYEEAIEDLKLSLKKSIALQSIYWKTRRLKAQCHIKLKQYEKAEFDLKLFTKRVFKEDSPNYVWRRHSYFEYGRVLIFLEKYEEAIEAFTSAMEIEEGFDKIKEEEKYYYLALAKQKAGKNGFIKELKHAAELGNKKAQKLLEEYA
jgi:tetratricopeptide (TPR) repeat protein